MTSITRDPLLAIAKGVLWFLMGVMGLAVAGCLFAIPAIIVLQDKVVAAVADKLDGGTGPEFVGAVLVICALAAVMLAILFRIFQLLKQIVDTVGEGDPFVPDNARRLTHMAWLTLAVQLVGLPIGGVALWLASVLKDKAEVHVATGGLDGNGLLLVLILFILARVFRKGAEMRAELEGTV